MKRSQPRLTATTHETPKPYPRHCWDASPTYSTWARLTAVDILALRQERGFEGQNVYFHLNHPITYVRVVGVVIDISFPGPSRRICILTIDDGSGATIGVKVAATKTWILKGETARLPHEQREQDDDDDNYDDREEGECTSARARAPAALSLQTLDTEVDDVTLRFGLGVSDVCLAGEHIDVGAVLRVKGVVSDYHFARSGTKVRQLALKRLAIVRSTSEEVEAWKQLAAFKRDVLSSPWYLLPDTVSELERRAQQAQLHRQRREVMRRAHYARKAARIGAAEDKREAKRRKLDAMFNAGALPGTDILVYGWTRS